MKDLIKLSNIADCKVSLKSICYQNTIGELKSHLKCIEIIKKIL